MRKLTRNLTSLKPKPRNFSDKVQLRNITPVSKIKEDILCVGEEAEQKGICLSATQSLPNNFWMCY